MIIFYDKKSGKIVGSILGRVHDKHTLEKSWVGDKKKTKRYIIPFVPIIKEVEVPIKEMRVVDKKTLRVEEVVIGKKKIKVRKGMKPSGCIKDLVLDFESKKKRIFDYRAKLNKKKELIGLVKI